MKALVSTTVAPLRRLVGVVLLGAMTGAVALSACSAGEPPTPRSADRSAGRAAGTPPLALRATAQPSAAAVASQAVNAAPVGSTAAPQVDPRAMLQEQARAAAQCDEPRSRIVRPSEKGVVFNNAMTSVDAGFIDRTQGILDAIAAKDTALRCCVDADASSGEAHVMLDMTLAADGKATHASVDMTASTDLNEVARECIAMVLGEQRYPVSPTNKETLVRYQLKVVRAGANAAQRP